MNHEHWYKDIYDQHVVRFKTTYSLWQSIVRNRPPEPGFRQTGELLDVWKDYVKRRNAAWRDYVLARDKLFGWTARVETDPAFAGDVFDEHMAFA